MAEAESVTVGNVTVALADVPAAKNARIPWILECDCEPMAYHCDQCDARRKARTEVENRERRAEVLRSVGMSTLTYKDGCEAWVLHGPHHQEGIGH